ncbi:hypothetical protein T439DRAFT_377320 [Meredithblackwellia eburnea MCA 4105]
MQVEHSPPIAHQSAPHDSYQFPNKQHHPRHLQQTTPSTRSISPSEYSTTSDTNSHSRPYTFGGKLTFQHHSVPDPADNNISRRSSPAADQDTRHDQSRPRTMETDTSSSSQHFDHYATSRAPQNNSQAASADTADDSTDPAPTEYSPLGKSVVGGAPIQRVLGDYPFSAYLSSSSSSSTSNNNNNKPSSSSGSGSSTNGAAAAHPDVASYPSPQHPNLVQFHGDAAHAALVQRHVQLHPNYQQGHPAPPTRQWSDQLPSCCAPGPSEQAHAPSQPHPTAMVSAAHGPTPSAHPPPHPQARVVYASDGTRMITTAYASGPGAPTPSPTPNGSHYFPYNGTPATPASVNMVRHISTNSSSSSVYSDSENYAGYNSSGNNSEYEGGSAGSCNPAYIHAAHNLSSVSLSGESTNMGGGKSGPGGAGSSAHYVYGTRSGNELRTVNSLKIDDDGTVRVPYQYGQGVRAPSSSSGGSSSGGGGAKRPNTRSASSRNVFHPTPQSMLAPHILQAARRAGLRPGTFPSSTAPILPSDDEFARMPTKRSRGRRPPCSPDLIVAGEDPNENPSEAQIRYCGVTKTGKPKKIFLCKVPQCGKCFKRSEHLKRHVRSIHTHEKPFQCQWPSCGKYFSRHDNLNQHLRVHRTPGQSDASFSQQLEACFAERFERGLNEGIDDDMGDF